MQIKANGITFNVAIDGPERAPWLVFSNSLATNLSMWDEQAARFAGRFRVLRYDQRGHGLTEASEGPYDFELLIADVLGLFDALSIDRAHFVGVSMGGMTALGLAEDHPERLLSVVPCDCSAGSTPASAQQWEERIKIAREKGMGPLVEPTLGRWFPAETIAAQPALADKVREMIRTTPVNGFAGCAAAIADFDFVSGLGTIEVPAFVIVGSKDPMLGAARQVRSAIRGAKLIEISGAGHLANLDGADAFNRTLEEFLGSV